MSEIKSEKAKERIEYYSDGIDFIYSLTKEQIVEVVEIAEQQAEQHHAKELQEFRDKATEALKYVYCENSNSRCRGLKVDDCLKGNCPIYFKFHQKPKQQ